MIYIALLRGINVSGQKAIKMTGLMKICESLNFNKISTYLQSGNVIFESKTTDPAIIETKLEQAIQESYNFDVKVFIRTIEELKQVVSGNPLITVPGIDMDKLHVTFLKNAPKEKEIPKIHVTKAENEDFIIKNREVYLYCPDGYGRTKLNNSAFEKKIKTYATTRNWQTTCAVLDIALGKNK